MPSLQSKLPNVGTTIFTVMSSMAAEYNAINLGQGFPDFSMDAELHQLVAKAMANDRNQYAHMFGLKELRDQLAAKAKKLYNANLDADAEITITPGGTYALFTAFATILKPGDEVIVIEPAYDSYVPQIELFGAKPVLAPMKIPELKIDWSAVRAAVNANTSVLVINTPHNPTGMVLTAADMSELQEIVLKHDLFIISDEVYEHLIFDDQQHESVLKYPEIYKRAFACYSFGKTYHCTGWKLGYCIAPPQLTKEFRKIHQFNCFSCHTPMQVAFAEYLSNENAYLNLGKEMQVKRDLLQTLLTDCGFTPLSSNGSYFQLFGYEYLSSEADHLFAERLVKEAGVATIPLSAFYQQKPEQKILRFCFAKKEDTLKEAADRLSKWKSG